jgi:hypothetical protein
MRGALCLRGPLYSGGGTPKASAMPAVPASVRRWPRQPRPASRPLVGQEGNGAFLTMPFLAWLGGEDRAADQRG